VRHVEKKKAMWRPVEVQAHQGLDALVSFLATLRLEFH